MLVLCSFLVNKVLLIPFQGVLHRIFDVNILQAAVRVELVRLQKLGIVTCNVLQRDPAIKSVLELIRLSLAVLLPCGFSL